MAEVSQVWMYDRNVILGKNIDNYFLKEILEYMDFRAVNEAISDEQKRELRTIDIGHPDEIKVLLNGNIIERMAKEVEYDVKLRTAVYLSSEYFFEAEQKKKPYLANKNKIANDDFQRFLPRIGKVTDNKFFFQIDTDGVNKKTLKHLEKMLNKAKEKGYDIQVVAFRGLLEEAETGPIPYMFDDNKLELLDQLNRICLQTTGNELLHQRAPSSIDIKKWKHSAVVKTNVKISKVAKDIFALGLSPLETMTVVHRYASSFMYNDFNTDPEDPRSLVGLLANEENIPQAICPAIASLEKAIIDRLNEMGFEGLKAELAFYKAFYSDRKKEMLHCYNLIQIEDKKYDTHGLYADDPTKDSPSIESPMAQGYSFFMVPISDLAKMYKLEKIVGGDVKYSDEAISLAVSKPFLKTVNMPLAKAQKVLDSELAKENSKPYKVLSRSGRGRAIPYTTFKKAVSVALKKLMPDNTNIDTIIALEIGASLLFAEGNFEYNASNCMIKKINSMSEEEYNDLQSFVFGKVVVDRNRNIVDEEIAAQVAAEKEDEE